LFQGHVVDWIELPHWPVFNLADSSIVCAGVLVVLLALRGIRLDGTKAAGEADPPKARSPEPDSPEPKYPEPQSRAAQPSADDSR
jgi:signal peptidase II